VFGIVRQSGGYIRINSQAGTGTEISVYLPSVTAAADVAGDTPTTATPIEHASETILLVDDDDVIRMLLERTLKQAGYNVLAASDGAAALELFQANDTAIQLLVTDMVMPHMGGAELVRAVTAIRPELKIVLMSGYSTSPEWRQDRVQGRYTYVQKPFTPRELQHTLREVLDAHGPSQH
jgi:DNA-binding NtrC family response regulator